MSGQSRVVVDIENPETRAAVETELLHRRNYPGMYAKADRHEMLNRGKVAALLALWDGRLRISDSDWSLAWVVVRVSRVAYELARSQLADSSAKTERAKGALRAEGTAGEREAEHDALDVLARKVAQKLTWKDQEGSGMTSRELNQSFGKAKKGFKWAEVISHAVDCGYLVEKDDGRLHYGSTDVDT